MIPKTLSISTGGHAVQPDILITRQSKHQLTLLDDRHLFLPSEVFATDITEPTMFGEYVLTAHIRAKKIRDETQTLQFEYVELTPSEQPGHVIFMHAVIPADSALVVVTGNEEKTPVTWVLAKRSVSTGLYQSITGLVQIRPDTQLSYAILSDETGPEYVQVNLESMVTIPKMEEGK
ncbi:MAG: hypothetical protein GW762_05350 [Candidatus Pacebacteria bacterium]|nr:hypothetical protein [Candidatus Paceibacterota bacterium]PIR63827.1 MAG: hypothetical protein COU64_02555 [Candidatus Pacebacteria bacterium CG10_big_fil_rev_8_21_14_0_10_40_26]PJA68782.1 MAG: hypothetical protein CO156_03560 [Candidatus Pacebacteria bacterium CG_4_9_14_3_um_filter_40_12]PJC41159.1 MAG: hypothetical protein CO041_06045 [Candidatus Pacebacteria bacterium CG_4_9_14_0_2_um_filter_40_15]